MKDEFLLEKAYLGWGIPVFVLNERNEALYRKWDADIPVNADAAEHVRRKWRENGVPAVWNETINIIHMGFEDDNGNLYLFGPVSFGGISKAQMQDYLICHRWKNSAGLLCYLPFDRMISCLSTMYVLLTGKRALEETIVEYMGKIRAEEEQEAWDFREDYTAFYGYRQECTFVEEFKQGEMRINEETILKEVASMELISPLARQNYIKNSEYAVVAAISIMRKAAVEMGVPEEICYRTSFQYFKRLSGCTTAMEMVKVYADAANELGRRIRKVKQKGNVGEIQELCKRYIAGNIRRKFTVGEMAEKLGYHPGYLSKVFTQREGICLQKYILKERLRLAANILRNSNEKIGTISDYLCFHSQSYMTEQFVKEYGMTPTQYRRKNAVLQTD